MNRLIQFGYCIIVLSFGSIYFCATAKGVAVIGRDFERIIAVASCKIILAFAQMRIGALRIHRSELLASDFSGGDCAAARIDDHVVRCRYSASSIAHAQVRCAAVPLAYDLGRNRLGLLNHVGYRQRRGFAPLGMGYTMRVKQDRGGRASRRPPDPSANVPDVDSYDAATAIDDRAPAHPRLEARLQKQQPVVLPACQAQRGTICDPVGATRKAVNDHGFAIPDGIAPIGNASRVQIGCQKSEVVRWIQRHNTCGTRQASRFNRQLPT
jgi:hypothetical protein